MNQTVAIIGGGLAGLRAALELRRAGVPVDLYEARDRLGGRAHTMVIDDRLLEIGAYFIDEINAEILSLAERYGLTVQKNYSEASFAMPIRFMLKSGAYSQREFNWDARPLSEALRRDAAAAEEFGTLPATTYLGRLSLSPKLREALEVLWDGEFGCSLPDTSAAALFDLALEELTDDQVGLFERGYVKYGITEGIGCIVGGLAEESEAKIHLDHILRRFAATPEGVDLNFDTPQGGATKRYGRVVIALPAAVLRTLDLGQAALPDDLAALVRKIPVGNNEKTIVYSSKAPVRIDEAVFDSSIRGVIWARPSGAGALISALHRTPDLGDEPEYLDRLRILFPELAGADLQVVMESDWRGSSYTLGSYTCFGGGPATRAALKRYQSDPPVNRHGNVVLAGEYLSPDYRVQSHMEGALLSGIRAARVALGR